MSSLSLICGLCLWSLSLVSNLLSLVSVSHLCFRLSPLSLICFRLCMISALRPCLYLCLSPLSVCLCLCLSISVSLSVSLCLVSLLVSVSVCLCLCFSLCVSLGLSVSVSLSLSLSLCTPRPDTESNCNLLERTTRVLLVKHPVTYLLYVSVTDLCLWYLSFIYHLCLSSLFLSLVFLFLRLSSSLCMPRLSNLCLLSPSVSLVPVYVSRPRVNLSSLSLLLPLVAVPGS